MWEEIGLIGRDRLLEREVYPRVRKKVPFLLVGQRGVGKSSVLEWAHENTEEPKALVSALWTPKEIMVEICRAWGLTITNGGKAMSPERASVAVLERAINSAEEGIIFVDDIHAASPAFLRRLKVWRERFTVSMAGTPPFRRDELKRILWGLHEIEIEPLKEPDRQRLAELVCQQAGSDQVPSEIAVASRGYPGRIVDMARGVIEQTAPRVRGEEIDLSPILLFGLAAVVAVRYVGIGLGEVDLYILGGIAMGLFAAARFFFWKGIKE